MRGGFGASPAASWRTLVGPWTACRAGRPFIPSASLKDVAARPRSRLCRLVAAARRRFVRPVCVTPHDEPPGPVQPEVPDKGHSHRTGVWGSLGCCSTLGVALFPLSYPDAKCSAVDELGSSATPRSEFKSAKQTESRGVVDARSRAKRERVADAGSCDDDAQLCPQPGA